MKKDYIEEEKLYRIYRKRENHINQKVNEDGMVAAIQFTDEANALDGPIFMKPVEDDEFERNTYIENGAEARSFKQIIWEEVIAPNLEYAIERALDIGFERLSIWAEEVAIPKAKKKTKDLWKDAKIIMSGVKDGLAGKEIKATRLIKESERTNLSVATVEPSVEHTEEEKELRSPEEVRQIIEAMRNSAMVIAAGIRLLSNTAITDDGSDPERKIEMQRNLEELSSDTIMNQINLLLEDKNRDLLDEASLRMMSAFREGNFIVKGEAVPISNYLSVK